MVGKFMPVFLPANKRKSKGIMRECAGLGCHIVLGLCGAFPSALAAFPPGALSHSCAAIQLNIKRSSNREPET